MFATKSLLELGGDECDNLNSMNFKIYSFKICKNSWILGNFKIRKIRIINLWLGRWTCDQHVAGSTSPAPYCRGVVHTMLSTPQKLRPYGAIEIRLIEL